MHLVDVRAQVRRARLRKRLTQQQLAIKAGLSRATVNQIERGALREIGVRRLSQLLHVLGLALNVVPWTGEKRPDFLRSVCISASTSYRRRLTVAQLRRTLFTGKVPAGLEPHFRVILEELPPGLLAGAIEEAGGRDDVPLMRRNLSMIARQLAAVGGSVA